MRMRNGFRKRYSNKYLYKKCGISRIDCFLTKSALKFIEKLPSIKNDCLVAYADKISSIVLAEHVRHMSPNYLKKLYESGMLSRNERLLFYHRRFKSLNINDGELVYNTDNCKFLA